MKVFVLFVALALIASAVAYTNPEYERFKVRNDEKDDMIGNKDGFNFDQDSFDVITAVRTHNVLLEGEVCDANVVNSELEGVKLSCAKDLVCLPDDIAACVGDSTKCTSKCVKPLKKGDSCHNTKASFCVEGTTCNMNTDGETALGVCTELFSLGAGSVASSSYLCQYGLVHGREIAPAATEFYNQRGYKKCLEPTVLQCNQTQKVISQTCSMNLVNEKYAEFKFTPHNDYFVCKATAETAECKFIAQDCEDIFKEVTAFEYNININDALYGLAGCRTKGCREARASNNRRLAECFDKLNYNDGNKAGSLQGSASTVFVSLIAVVVFVFTLF